MMVLKLFEKKLDFGGVIYYIRIVYIVIGIRREVPRLYFSQDRRTVGSPRGPERFPVTSVGTVRHLLFERRRQHGIAL